MRVQSGFVCRAIGSEHVVVAVNEKTREFRGLVQLNALGAFLWFKMQQDFTYDSLTQIIVDEYGISAQSARQDVVAFVQTLIDANIIEE